MSDQPNVSHKWHPIEDLPANWADLARSGVAALGGIWVGQAERLKESQVLKDFNTRLRRQWAIETGILERIYSIDRGVTNLLIERGLDASLMEQGSTDKSPDYIAEVLKDHQSALDGLFDFVSGNLPLTTSYIRQLHQELCRSQHTTAARDRFGRIHEVALLKGDWKKEPNNPQREDGSVHEYCPPEQVAPEIDRLIELHQSHVRQGVPPEVEAAWLHHRFTQIHPFQDGNGRVARALASLILLRAGWFPLVIDRDVRGDYIETLETADRGDLEPLVGMIARSMNQAFLGALSLSDEVLTPPKSYRQIIDAAVDHLRKKDEVKPMELKRVLAYSQELEDVVAKTFLNIAEDLTHRLKGVAQKIPARFHRSTNDQQYAFKHQIAHLGLLSGYTPNLGAYHNWLSLTILAQGETNVVVSFHSLGPAASGALAVLSFVELPNGDLRKTCTEPFAFTHTENLEEITRRFNEWFNEVTIIALNEWRKQL